ncbi:transposase family protein [Streptomyces roseolus]|uniref:transposase family protein n=1 Tax=Streptomyces roseolus TaxID=67358 RepID=UPI0036325D84
MRDQPRRPAAGTGGRHRPPRGQWAARHHRRHRGPGPPPGRRTQGSGRAHPRKNKQNAVKTVVLTDQNGRVLFGSPAMPGSCADITRTRQSDLVELLADGPAVEILADAGYQGLGARTGGRVVTPPHRKFEKGAPDWYEETHERQRKAHSSRRIRVEHGIAPLKNWRALARHLSRCRHIPLRCRCSWRFPSLMALPLPVRCAVGATCVEAGWLSRVGQAVSRPP